MIIRQSATISFNKRLIILTCRYNGDPDKKNMERSGVETEVLKLTLNGSPALETGRNQIFLTTRQDSTTFVAKQLDNTPRFKKNSRRLWNPGETTFQYLRLYDDVSRSLKGLKHSND